MARDICKLILMLSALLSGKDLSVRYRRHYTKGTLYLYVIPLNRTIYSRSYTSQMVCAQPALQMQTFLKEL